MPLSTQDRARVRHEFAERLSRIREPLGLTKPELLAAVEATDDWIQSNAGSYNAALPQPARAALTASQKAHLFMLVAQRRFG